MFAKQHTYKYSHEVGFGGVGCEDEILRILRLKIILARICRGPEMCFRVTGQKYGFHGGTPECQKMTKMLFFSRNAGQIVLFFVTFCTLFF